MSMSHDEMIAVIQAHKDGKEIEQEDMLDGNRMPFDGVWNFDGWKYRIKPEPVKPKTIWVNEYNSGCYIHASKKDAVIMATSNNAIRTAVEYQEVIK